jgi:peroxiredoxin
MNVNKLLIGGLIIGIGAIVFLNVKIGSKNSTTLTQTVTIGSIAPDFSLTTLDKESFKLSDKKGKTVILFGMAGWCGTCIPEGRALTRIRNEYMGKELEVIGVAFTKGDNEDFLKEFRELGTVNMPLALDTDNVASKYQLVRLETSYIINKDGVIVYKDEGFTSYEDYKRELDKII